MLFKPKSQGAISAHKYQNDCGQKNRGRLCSQLCVDKKSSGEALCYRTTGKYDEVFQELCKHP